MVFKTKNVFLRKLSKIKTTVFWWFAL